jgi:hypothetical protein
MINLASSSVVIFLLLALVVQAAIPVSQTFNARYIYPLFSFPSVTHSGQTISITITLVNAPGGVDLATSGTLALYDLLTNLQKTLTTNPNPISGTSVTYTYTTKSTDTYTAEWFCLFYTFVEYYPFVANAVIITADIFVDSVQVLKGIDVLRATTDKFIYISEPRNTSITVTNGGTPPQILLYRAETDPFTGAVAVIANQTDTPITIGL